MFIYYYWGLAPIMRRYVLIFVRKVLRFNTVTPPKSVVWKVCQKYSALWFPKLSRLLESSCHGVYYYISGGVICVQLVWKPAGEASIHTIQGHRPTVGVNVHTNLRTYLRCKKLVKCFPSSIKGAFNAWKRSWLRRGRDQPQRARSQTLL